METFTRWQDPTIEEYKQLIKNWKEKYYQMKEERNKQKEVLDKIKEYIEYNACCLHDEEILNHILELLEEIK